MQGVMHLSYAQELCAVMLAGCACYAHCVGLPSYAYYMYIYIYIYIYILFFFMYLSIRYSIRNVLITFGGCMVCQFPGTSRDLQGVPGK